MFNVDWYYYYFFFKKVQYCFSYKKSCMYNTLCNKFIEIKDVSYYLLTILNLTHNVIGFNKNILNIYCNKFSFNISKSNLL